MNIYQFGELPSGVSEAIAVLERAGHRAYPVGGCVRDRLMGREPSDWDICTSARPTETVAAFRGFRVIETGVKHGTVTVLAGDMPLEITTFRSESGYGDLRHPDRVTFISSLEADLARRDFTVNAMAADRTGRVIDPFGGREDLAAGLIRCVGSPEERFGEDALRILRALRFASRLGFAIEAETAAAVRRQRELLRRVSPERIFSELKGILAGPGAGDILEEFPEVFFVFLPELAPQAGFDQKNPHHDRDLWSHTAAAVAAAPPDPLLRLTMLLHDAGKPGAFTVDGDGTGHFYGHGRAGAEMAEDILRRLRCDNGTRQTAARLIALHDTKPPQTRKGTRRLLLKLGAEDTRRLLACWRADAAAHEENSARTSLARIDVTEELLEAILREESCFSLGDLAVKGDDLIAAGMRPGPALGAALRELFRLVTEEGVPNDRRTLLEQIKKTENTQEGDCLFR